MIRIFKDGEEIIKEKDAEEKGESIEKKVLLKPPDDAPSKRPKETPKKAVNVEKRGGEHQFVALPRGELTVIRQVEYALDGDPLKKIIIGVLNRALNVEEVEDNHAWRLAECPYYNECIKFIIKSNISSYTCSLCKVFQEHVLVKRSEKK